MADPGDRKDGEAPLAGDRLAGSLGRTRRVLELFSGVGGWRLALGSRAQVVAAYDISPLANATYALNHGHTPGMRELASVPPPVLLAHRADTWVLSPPCQPFCRMGNGEGLDDPRSLAYLAFLRLLEQQPPEAILLENVVGYLRSEAFCRLVEVLDRHRFHWKTWTLCPTRFGFPNQRPRAYLAASRTPLQDLELPDLPPPMLGGFLDPEEQPGLYLAEAHLRHKPGMDLVRQGDRRSACFIGGYGQRFMGSGSFLVTERGIRRFSPTEVARLLGYPADFRFPEDVPLKAQYKLLGNGLHIAVARWVSEHLPGFDGADTLSP